MNNIRLRIFVAEDSRAVLESLLAMIETVERVSVAGMSSQTAEAIPQIERLSPDLAILDLRLADGSGLDILRAIRAGGRKKPLVVIFSSNVTRRLKIICFALGADYVFDKARESSQLEDLLISLAARI